MNIAFVTYFTKESLKSHHGRWYYIAETLKNLGHNLIFIDDLSSAYQDIFKVKSFYYNYFTNKNYLRLLDKKVTVDIALQAKRKIETYNNIDLIFAPGTIEIAYLKTDIPIVVWTDTTFFGLYEFYDKYKNMPEKIIRDASQMDELAHQNAEYIMYPSEWAKKDALNNYDVADEKVKVINFGSTIESKFTEEEIIENIDNKRDKPLKLFFAGIEWNRKGGEDAIAAFQLIRKSLKDAELHIAGIDKEDITGMDNVYTYGFLKKDNPEEYEKLKELFSDSHFFIVPSKAETFGMVFAEAGSYGLPVITSNIGGIPAVIKNGVNGFTLDLDEFPKKAADIIIGLYTDKEKYKALSLSSFNEFKERLNWERAGKELKKILDTFQK